MQESAPQGVPAPVRARVLASERRRAWSELIAAGASLLVSIATKRGPWSVWVMVALLAAWGTYLLLLLVRDPSNWHRWGLSADNARPAARILVPITAVGVAGLVVYAFVAGPAHVPTLHVMTGPAYAFWAFAQDFAVFAVFVSALATVGMPRSVLPFVTAFAFGAGHWPDVPTGLLAAVGGFAWTWTWLRHPNLWVIACSHTLLGGLALIVLLGHDPVPAFLRFLE